MVQLPRLAALHSSMQQEGKTRSRFVWDTRRLGARFSVIFLTDIKPMVLIFGLIGGKFAFEREVNEHYEISAYLGGKLNEFKDALKLQYKAGEPFRTSAIFAEFAESIPTTAVGTLKVSYRDIPVTRDIEKADQIYFVGWRLNGSGEQTGPYNLAKTRFYFGDEIAARCQKSNASSRWSDDPLREKPFTSPPVG